MINLIRFGKSFCFLINESFIVTVAVNEWTKVKIIYICIYVYVKRLWDAELNRVIIIFDSQLQN